MAVKGRGFEDASVTWGGLLPSQHILSSGHHDPDFAIRTEAFTHLRRLNQFHDHLTAAILAEGFIVAGETIALMTRARGIFKPRQMKTLLSIRTAMPRPGRKIWYDDQREVHRQIYQGDETVDYAFQGDNPEATDNRLLREAKDMQLPIIYFLGVAPGVYQAIFPTFIVDWDPSMLKARLAFGASENATMAIPQPGLERRYALRSVKQRLHQNAFREAVMAAYAGRCAITRLPESRLLDAAHIIGDANEDFGQPVVQNGILLSKIHHAAFDRHLIGIDENYALHVSNRLLKQKDGPMLEAMKDLQGSRLQPPERLQDQPDRDRLRERFKIFKQAA